MSAFPCPSDAAYARCSADARGGQVPPAPSASLADAGLPTQDEVRAIVAELYGQDALDYERKLLIDCAYRTPQMLAETVVAALPESGHFGVRACREEAARGGGAPAAAPRWLDLGAGTGLVGKALRDRKVKAELVALDASAAMLRHLDSTLYAERHQADVTNTLPFPSRHFDAALAAGLLEHVVDVGPLLCEVARILVPNGALFLTFCPNDDGRTALFEPLSGLLSHDERSLRACLWECGFHIENERVFDAYRSGRDGWIRNRLVFARCATAPSVGSPA